MLTIVKDAEIKLVEMVGGLAEEAISWRAVYFNFDKLQEQYRSQYQIQIAVNLLSDLLGEHEGGVFVCFDQTIFMICRNISKNKIDKAIFQLRYLFIDDPLAYDSAGEENPNFCRVFDLGREYAEFYHLCRRKLSQSKRVERTEEEMVIAPIGEAPQTSENANVSFTPTRLAHIEHDLNKADLSRMLRRQPICAMSGKNARRVFDEYYIHISHLRRMLNVKTDFFSNRLLFAYLTQILDERMLDLLSMSPLRYLDSPVSLNFNVETLLSRKFREFDTLIKPLVKFSIVIEIQIGDVFGDIRAFVAARNIVQQMGYKICVDGLTNFSIVQIDREKLGFDFAKLQWNADLEEDIGARENQKIMEAVKSFGFNRVILSRCDNAQAVNYGQAMGINLFQGRYIDNLLNPTQKVEN
ncbi:MAG TPA: hypothetical protein VFT64_04800 [Rickettsiales bacterium]|nr:hypothetical protein [Rickettsiales bacterium]